MSRFSREISGFALIFTCLLAFAPGNVWAAACKITVTAANFGAYDPLSSVPKDGIAQLNISCNHKVDTPAIVQVLISEGNSGSVAQRQMAGAIPESLLLYNLYVDASMSSIFGDGTAGTVTMTNTVDRTSPWDIPIYGQIPALQNVPVGVYTDGLTVTFLY
jgi:spore coat protein U-like protein